MALHRLLSVTLGVPDVPAAATFYRDFGLTESRPGTFATTAGGDQLRLEPATRRRLVSWRSRSMTTTTSTAPRTTSPRSTPTSHAAVRRWSPGIGAAASSCRSS